MIFSKQELHRRGDDVTRKGWTTRFYHDFLDSVWREPFINRSSGFDVAGGPDSVIAFDNNTRIFTISPVTNKFAFWQFIVRISFFKRYEPMELEIPDEEGLYLIYLFRDEEDKTHKRQKLFYTKNPTVEDIREVYLNRVIVAWIYWNFNDKSTVYFGDERHGSEWNPKIHLWAHEAFNAFWKSGFSVTGLNPGDGSDNSHAQFGIASGEFSHEDMEHAVSAVAATTGLPVMWFDGSYPGIESNPGYSFLRGPDFLFNNAGNTKTECTDGFFMLYHVLASNCQLYPLISVMGLKQYENKNDCCKAAYGEMQEIKRKLPQQTVLPVASFAFEVSHEFTNDVKARIVEPCSGQGCFLWIENVLNWYDIQIQIEIEEADSEVLTDKSVTGDGTLGGEIELVNDEETPGDLKYYGTGDAGEPDKGFHHLYSKLVNQTSHGFAVKQAIRHNGTSFVLAKADSATNAQVAGIVVEVIDANNFRYQSEGFFAHNDWVAGTEYALSPNTAGLIIEMPNDSFVWQVGWVRLSLGWGTDRGLKIEIDVGDEIGELLNKKLVGYWDREFEFCINKGIVEDFIVDLYACYDYTVVGAILMVDNGTVDVGIELNGVSVAGLENITVSTTPTYIQATGNNVVVDGDMLKMVTTVTYTEDPVFVHGKLKIVRE